jgi:hypothetical protein
MPRAKPKKAPVVYVRVSEGEMEELEHGAQMRALSVTAFVRMNALEEARRLALVHRVPVPSKRGKAKRRAA